MVGVVEIAAILVDRGDPERRSAEVPDVVEPANHPFGLAALGPVPRGRVFRGWPWNREAIPEIQETGRNELGHYFGLEDDEMPY